LPLRAVPQMGPPPLLALATQAFALVLAQAPVVPLLASGPEVLLPWAVLFWGPPPLLGRAARALAPALASPRGARTAILAHHDMVR